MLSRLLTPFLISLDTLSSAWPATSLSNFSVACSHLNGREARPGKSWTSCSITRASYAPRTSGSRGSGKSDGDLLQFESPAALFRVLTAKRWELIERLQTTGPLTLRGLARELDRDVKRVHEDVGTLIKLGC